MSKEIQYIISLLESGDQANGRLGILLAKHHQKTFESVFQMPLKVYHELREFLMKYEVKTDSIYLKKMKVLNLTDKQIQSLPKYIGILQNLEELYLGDNALTMLPTSIKNLRNLRILDLASNLFEELPQIGNLKNLESLYLDYNPLKSLPDGLRKLKKLELLSLQQTPFESLPEGFLFSGKTSIYF